MNISPDVWIGVLSSLAGTILGWFLGIAGNTIGPIKIEFSNITSRITGGCKFEDNPHLMNSEIPRVMGFYNDYMDLSFEIVVYNGKNITCGINSCKLFYKFNNETHNLISFFTDENNIKKEFEKLLNIESKTTKKIKIHYDNLSLNREITGEYRVFLEYKVNGEKRVRKSKSILVREIKG